MTKLLFLEPQGIKAGQPSYERIAAFKNFYKNNGLDVQTQAMPVGIFAILKLIFFCKKNAIDYLFISMPPFRAWLLFFFFKKKMILDIRDGWSIAMQTGYGGTSKPTPLKAKFARMIERFAIKRSAFSITCTPGLKTHLEKVSGKTLLLILNGVSQENYQYIQEAKQHVKEHKNTDNLNVICTGQFSEYGQDKVKRILQQLSVQFPNRHINLNILGANQASNAWVNDYIQSKNYQTISFKLCDRMPKQEMYQAILSSDIAISLIRDTNYDFGTKVFEYILCQTPIFNYFESPNPFSRYFKDFLYSESQPTQKNVDKEFIRENILERDKTSLLEKLMA